jgi:hypothetical protein
MITPDVENITFDGRNGTFPNQSNQAEDNTTWKSCCLKVDKNAMKYFIQVAILSGLIIFSACMLVIDDRCESQRNYSSLLMISLGTLIPAPKLS